MQTLFPDIPRDPQVIDLKSGMMKPQWQLFFAQLNQTLQTNLTSVGFLIPRLTSTLTTDFNNDTKYVGNIVFNSTSNEFKGIVAAVGSPPIAVKTFTLT